MSAILLTSAGVMGAAGRSGDAVRAQARRYEAEDTAREEDRFVPRDLIRLCQFIEVWIPKH